MRVGGGTFPPADGFSFCFANNLPAGGWGEEGIGNGLIVAFDVYDNGNGEAPSVDLKWNGATFREHRLPIEQLLTGADFVNVQIKVDPDGSVDVTYNGLKFYEDVQIPGFAPVAGAKYGFGARTGGLNVNQWVDNIDLTTTTGPLQLRFTTPPRSLTAQSDSSITLRSGVNDSSILGGLQWQRKGPSDAAFTDIAGATSDTYTTPPLALLDNGVQFRVTGSSTVSGDIVNSDPATITVINIPIPTPDIAFSFDDGTTPAGATLFGDAVIAPNGGVSDSGSLSLTTADNGKAGAMILAAPRGDAAVDSMTAAFALRIGPGTDVPADGFSFNWASDLPDGTFGEDGAGTGLTIAFDIFDNGGGEGPSIDVKWNGTVLASKHMTIAEMALAQFAETVVHLESDGTVDVIYAGEVVHNNVKLPGFTALAGGRFGFGARTGGLNAAQVVDDLRITTTVFTGPVVFTKQPANAIVLVGSTATFNIAVNDPARSTYQWQRKGPSDADFSNIAGANGTSYTTGPLTFAESGSSYRAVATGPLNTANSDAAVVTVLDLARPTTPNVDFTFDDGAVPAGTVLQGTASTRISTDGGVGGTGVLHLTDALNGEAGSFTINDFNTSKAVDGFTAAWSMRVGGGSNPPADGFSFNWATDLPDNPTGGPGGGVEDGVGTGLSIAFDIFDNGGGEGPSIDVRWKGNLVAQTKVPLEFLRGGDEFREVLVRLTTSGTVDVAYNGTVVHHDVALPGFNALGGARFGLSARTGGLNENQWVDNLAIQTHLYAGPVTIITQPVGKTVVPGKEVTYTVVVNDPSRASYQWQTKAAGAADFTAIAGATDASYTAPAATLADNGRQYRVVVSAPGNTVNSDAVTLTVVDIQVPTVHTDFNFDDGLVPEGTQKYGNAEISTTEGVEGSGSLVLTRAVNGQASSFIIDDLNAGAPANGLTAVFQLRIGEGTVPPADGFSFAWANDIGNGPFGEDGSGSGLVVSFDSFDNGGGEAPAVDVRYNGTPVGPSVKVPASFYNTQGEYVPVIIRVETDGTLDVVYNSEVIFYNLQLPGYKAPVGARVGFGARTGGLNEVCMLDNIQIGGVASGPLLNAGLVNGKVVITFEGTLEAADTANGPYTPVLGATSPLTVDPTGPQKFYRARQ